MSSPSTLLPSAKLAERIQTLVEQPPFISGGGGYAATDRSSFAEARALLTLVAFQAYPVLVRRYPQLRIWSLLESHPQDGTTGVADSANVRCRPVEAGQGREGYEVSLAGGAAPVPGLAAEASTPASAAAASSGSSEAALPLVHLRVELPLRSSATGRVLEIGEIRRHMWRALLLGVAGKGGQSEAQLSEGVEAQEREFRDKYFPSVPQDVVHLVWMGVLRPNYVEEFEAYVASVAQPKEGRGSVSKTDHRSSAVGLWWPPREGAVTYVEMQRQRREKKAAEEALKVVEAEEVRELRRRAAEQRMGLGSSSAGGGSSSSSSSSSK